MPFPLCFFLVFDILDILSQVGKVEVNGLGEFLRNMDWAALGGFLLSAVAVLLCLTVHEVSHGLAAYALGDPTAKEQNRLSLNPLHHLDGFGTLMMLVAGFGWAKPVPVNMSYFRHPKSGMAVTALAGPVSNFLLAYLALLARAVLLAFYLRGGGMVLSLLVDFTQSLAVLSVGLGIFNLIPIPPLDGSKVLEGVLPDRIYYTILRYEQIGMLLLIALLFSGMADGPLWEARVWVLNAMNEGAYWLFMLVDTLI